MSQVHKRVVAAILIAYLATLAGIVFWPTSDVPTSSVRWMHARLVELGVPVWVSTSPVEFVSNIVLFVPLSFLAALLWLRRSWIWWTLAGFAASLMIETAQMVQLPDRSPTVADVVANTLGALIGALLVLPVRSRLRMRSR